MRKKHKKQPRYRLLKATCVGAGLLSISNPTQVTAADIGLYDVHNDQSLGTIPNPFPSSSLGVHVAVGDLNGDGFGDIIMGPGRGAAEFAYLMDHFLKISEKCCRVMLPPGEFSPDAGVRVATGDLDGDGKAEIIVTPATGPGSQAAALKLAGDKFQEIDSTDALFDGFAGGVSVVISHLDGDPDRPVIVAARAAVDGRHIKKAELTFAAATDFETPHPDSSGGLQIAMGDINGDGVDEILTLANSSSDGLAHASVNDAKHSEAKTGLLFFDDTPAGVHVALGDVDGDGRADLVVGAPRGFDPYLKIYSLEESPLLLDSYLAVQKFNSLVYDPSFRGGVRVAAGDINGDGFADIAFAPGAIPEPATIASLFAAIGTWLLGSRRRRRDEGSG